MADLATLQARLAEAEEALHQLSIGKKVVEVQTEGGERVRYQSYDADVSRLRAYVVELKGLIAEAGGAAPMARLGYVTPWSEG